MSKGKSRRARFGSRAFMGWSIIGFALVSALSTGCFESSTEVGETAYNFETSEITLSDVQAKVSMSEEQAQGLSQALSQWRAAERELSGRNEADFSGNPPILEFLASSASVLDHEQMLQLLEFLSEHQGEQMRNAQRGPRAIVGPGQGQGRFGGPAAGRRSGRGEGNLERPRRGPGGDTPGEHRPGMRRGGRGGMGPLLGELDLSEEQLAAVRAAFEDSREASRSLHEAFANGELSEEDFAAGRAEIRSQRNAAVQEILTEEQYTRLQELKAERLVAALERQLERMGTGAEQRLELLTSIIDLNEQQQQDIAAIHDNMQSEMETLLESLRAGAVSVDEARSELQRIRLAARDATRALLTEEQGELFDALFTLLRHGCSRHPRP